MGRYSKIKINDVLKRKLKLLKIDPYAGDGTPQFKLLLNLIGVAYENDETIIHLIENGIIRLVRNTATQEDAYTDGVCKILLREAIQPSMGLYMNIAISIVGDTIVHCCIIGDKFDITYKEVNGLSQGILDNLTSGSDISTFIGVGDVIPVNGTKLLSILGEDYSKTQLMRMAQSWVVAGLGTGDDWVLTPAGNVFRIKMSKERTSLSSGGKCIVTEISSMKDIVAFMQKDTELQRAQQQFKQFKRLDLDNYRDMIIADSMLVPVCTEYRTDKGEEAYKVAKSLELLGHELTSNWFSQMKTKALALERGKQLDDGGIVKIYKSSQAIKHNADDLTPGGKGIFVYEVINKHGRVVGYYSYKDTVEKAISIAKIMSTERANIKSRELTEIPIVNSRGVLGKGKNNITSPSRVYCRNPIKIYNAYSDTSTYRFVARKNGDFDNVLHIGKKDASVKIRRWLDREMETFNIIENIWSTRIELSSLKTYADRVLTENNTPGINKYFRQLGETNLYFLTGAECKVIPVLTWTSSVGNSDEKLAIRPVKLEGLYQIGIDGNRKDVYALAVACYERFLIDGQSVFMSGTWITTCRKGIDVRNIPEFEVTWNGLIGLGDEQHISTAYGEALDFNHIAESVRSSEAIRILENSADIAYVDAGAIKWLEEKGEKPLKYWYGAVDNIKIIQKFSISGYKVALCGTKNGQLIVYADSNLAYDGADIHRSFMYGEDNVMLLVKNKESVNRIMLAMYNLNATNSNLAASIMRLIGMLQQYGEQNKEVYINAIHTMLACEGKNRVFCITEGPDKLSQLDSFASEIIEYIGVPGDVYGKKYSALNMGTSIQDAIESQRMMSSMEEDEEYDIDYEYDLEDEEDELAIDNSGNTSSINDTSEEDGEILDDEYDDIRFDDEDEIFNMADESLGWFKDSNGMKVTWVMVMNKVCREDDRLKASATDMETLRRMWMPNYLNLSASGKVEESLKSLWEL